MAVSQVKIPMSFPFYTLSQADMQANIKANVTSPKINIAGSQIVRSIGLAPRRWGRGDQPRQ
jgi:hypothetical protein